MNGRNDANATIDQPGGGPVRPLPERFEAAWKKALTGGPSPSLETFLADAPADQPTLRDLLARIDGDYRQRLAMARSLQGAAILGADSGELAPPGGGTVAIEPEDAASPGTRSPSDTA